MQPPKGMNKSDSFITFKKQVIKMKNIVKKSGHGNIVKKVGKDMGLLKIKNRQATPIAPLNLIPLLCSQPGGVKGSWS